MPGRSITDLAWPETGDLISQFATNFETEEDAAAEDGLRIKGLNSQAAKHGGDWGERAKNLADRLDPELHPATPTTCASSRYMCEQRIRILSSLLGVTREDEPGDYVRADIVKPGWGCDAVDLQQLDPTRLLKGFRADIIRVAAANPTKPTDSKSSLCARSKGYLFAAVHGEFDEIARRFQPHLHVWGTGRYVSALDGLRRLKGYKKSDIVRTPVRLTREIHDLPGALTYLLKSYWPQRPFLPLGADGAPKRPRKSQRIDEPYHSEVLLWLDQWRLSDLVLMMGLRVGKHGLRLI